MNLAHQPNARVVLLVEDNPGDVRLVMETLQPGSKGLYLQVVRDGIEALDYLRKAGKFSHSPSPDLILLDLNLPKKNGLEVLAEIKADKFLHHIPVVVLTMSKSMNDVLAAYDLHANCYVVKPIDLNEYIRIIDGIWNFWLSKALLPSDYL